VSQKELNLGILAHVDAGKTTLTERLLYEAGVISELGSVDAGTTQTDSLALERQRGITIRSAVTSFALKEVHVNLIDTPGHPDFIAEVERVLSVLDGAVLVVSAVEGVQPQTRILMRALQRLRIPTLIFVNKIDRVGADDERVLQAISERLSPAIVPMGTAHALGTRAAYFTHFGAEDHEFESQLAEVLAEHDAGILASYVESESGVPYGRLRDQLASQTKRALVHPVMFGSALTGAGVESLMADIGELLPSSAGDASDELSATVFKIERGPSGEKIAYVRVFSGTIRTRDRVHFGDGLEDKVTEIAVFERGPAVQRPLVSAGAVAKLWGLKDVQIGDSFGERGTEATHHQFPPPTLEAVVAVRNPGDRARLRVALAQLAEQDPLINIRQDDRRQEIVVSLYGEVQKEVIEATLASEYGLDVEFRETTTICIERPLATGEAVEILNTPTNPFHADLGLRVDPAARGSGVAVALDVDPREAPLYAYKTFEAFTARMGEYVRAAFEEGLFGWRVTDCSVTVTKVGYSLADGPPSRRGPMPTPGDFRKLTPIVLMRALEQARTAVCEPVVRVRVETPTEVIGPVLAALGRLDAPAGTLTPRGELSVLETVLPAARVQDLRRLLPGLTGGEGALEFDFAGYEPVIGAPPTRRRTTPNPLNLDEYVAHLAGHRAIVAGATADRAMDGRE
jgi:ribosomal protection tetracycline resistance protein